MDESPGSRVFAPESPRGEAIDTMLRLPPREGWFFPMDLHNWDRMSHAL